MRCTPLVCRQFSTRHVRQQSGKADGTPPAAYDAATQTVRLTPLKYLRQGSFYKLSLIGTVDLTDLVGNRLDGDMNGTSGDNCEVGIVRGTKLRYTDSNGDSVSLSLIGGGAMEMVRELSGDALAKLKLLSGTSGVINSLGNPPVEIESTSASVVDLLLTSGRL